MRTRKQITSIGLLARLLVVACTAFLVSCGGGSGSDGGGNDNQTGSDTARDPALSADIKATRTMTSVGGTIEFEAQVVAFGTTVRGYAWELSDGRTETGQRVAVAFPAEGQVQVSLTVTSDNAAPVVTETFVSVIGSSSQGPAGFGLPEVYGDFDQDGELDLADALGLAQSLSGVLTPSVEQQLAADLNLSGQPDSSDLALVMRAVGAGTALASAVLNEFAYPGGTLSILSDKLLDPDAEIEIQVAGIPALPPARAVLGYATTVVPDPLGTFGDSVPVTIIRNREIVETLTVEIRQPAQVPADTVADLSRFFDEYESLLRSQVDDIRELFAANGTPLPADSPVLATTQAGVAMVNEARQNILDLYTSGTAPRIVTAFQKSLYANGLSEFREELASLSASLVPSSGSTIRPAGLTPEQVCDVMIPSVCALKNGVSSISNAGNFIAGSCSALTLTGFVGGALFPVDGPAAELTALAAFARYCVPLITAAKVGNIAATIVSPIDLSLKSQATPSRLGSGQMASVTATVSFLGLDGICSQVSAAGIQAVVEQQFRRKIAGAILKNTPSLRILADFQKKFGGNETRGLLESIQQYANLTLDAAGLTNAFASLLGSVCPNLTAGSAVVPVSKVFSQPPVQSGFLTFNTDGSGTYTCPPAGPVFDQNVTLQGSLRLCSDRASTSVAISCSITTVTIFIGDTGNLLDDIFEVVIDGITVLTSSSPVRQISAEVSLQAGRRYVVIMRGLAAPDGVGTYGIAFDGARVVSGDPQSGDDLVPGTTKQFVIEVI